MTTIAISPKSAGVVPGWLKLLILILLGTVLGRVLLGAHAVDKHRNEAATIRHCLEQNGYIERWQNESEPNVEAWCVEIEDEPCSIWGIMIAQIWPSIVTGCDYRERTSFVPRDGSPDAVRDYLSRDFIPME